MALLVWTPDLDTGIEKIDTQHKKIVEYINQLHDVQQTGDRAEVLEVMEGLVNYTATHFAEEEAMLVEAGYELTETHKGVHERFVDKVSKLFADHAAGKDTAEELLNLLEGWLFTHIRINDMAYVETVKAKGF
ncbi:bacteriohemerythrin [Luteimonas sp. e5]